MKSVEEMLKELEVATKEMLFVPNDLLPEAFHDDVRGGRTLARLDELCEEIADGETAHQKAKAAKALTWPTRSIILPKSMAPKSCPKK